MVKVTLVMMEHNFTKCFNKKKIKSPYAWNKNLSPKLAWTNNSRFWLKQKDKAPFIPNNAVNLFIAYELNRWSKKQATKAYEVMVFDL